MIKACKMKEPSSQGDPFTWGGRRGDHWVSCKLDRCFGNKDWLDLFPDANQSFLEKRGSDHRPVLVNLNKVHQGRKGRFRFDKTLLGLPNFRDKIVEAWRGHRGQSNLRFAARIRNCRTIICEWKKSFSLNAKANILRIQNELEAEESGRFPSRVRIQRLKIELVKAIRDEESFWFQRSQDKWLKCGDMNTKAFHASVQMARSRNAVDVLEDKNGLLFQDDFAKGEIATNYF
ncbi:hypothetical protein YC2023_057342 [Brassica napus]